MKVRVNIREPKKYVQDAFKVLNVQVGIVDGQVGDDDVVVRFNPPLKNWWKWGKPVYAFVFSKDELEELP